MAYLEPGIYHIKNVESGLFAGRAINEDYSLAPKRIVGVCEKPSQFTTKWTVEALEGGYYRLLIRKDPATIHHDKIFAQLLPDPTTKWIFFPVEGKNIFRITNTHRAWVLEDRETAQIGLVPYFEDWTDPNTVWHLIPVDGS